MTPVSPTHRASFFYVVTDAEGKITKAVSYDGSQVAPPGAVLISGEQYRKIDLISDKDYYLNKTTKRVSVAAKVIDRSERRKREYPAIEEQVGALMKIVDVLILDANMTGIPQDALDVLAQVRETKKKHSK